MLMFGDGVENFLFPMKVFIFLYFFEGNHLLEPGIIAFVDGAESAFMDLLVVVDIDMLNFFDVLPHLFRL